MQEAKAETRGRACYNDCVFHCIDYYPTLEYDNAVIFQLECGIVPISFLQKSV